MPHWIGTLIIAAICVAGCFARLARDRKLRQAGMAPTPRRVSPAMALIIFLPSWIVCAYFIGTVYARGFPQSYFFLGMFAFLTVAIAVAARSLIRQRYHSA
jgi:hypothetical protein